MICRIADALGLTYVPQDVLKDEQITALVKGAVARETSREILEAALLYAAVKVATAHSGLFMDAAGRAS